MIESKKTTLNGKIYFFLCWEASYIPNIRKFHPTAPKLICDGQTKMGEYIGPLGLKPGINKLRENCP